MVGVPTGSLLSPSTSTRIESPNCSRSIFVPARHVVGYGDDVVAGVERRAVVIDGDGIVRLVTTEHGGVEVEAAISRQDLADDLELAGGDGSRQHVGHKLGYAVDAAEHHSGVVRVAHDDAHVERVIAVNEVVAASALDDIAAVAAEDDVAGRERGHAGPEQLLQTADEADVGERAVLRAGDIDLGQVGIVAAQDVAEIRSRQAFHLGESIEYSRGRWRHGRFNEVVDVEVDSHAELIELVAGPVETAAAAEMVLAVGADHGPIPHLCFLKHWRQHIGYCLYRQYHRPIYNYGL